jgi:hypothetical protein
MKSIAAFCATCLVAVPAYAQTDTTSPTTTAQTGSAAPEAGAGKPAPTISAQRGEAPAEEPAGDKPAEPAPEPGAPTSEPATPKA